MPHASPVDQYLARLSYILRHLLSVLHFNALFVGCGADTPLAGVGGFEPPNARVKVWCLTAWRYPNIESIYLYLYYSVVLIFQKGNIRKYLKYFWRSERDLNSREV